MIPKFFIGIDISKLTLDVAVLESDVVLSQFKIANTESAIEELFSKLKGKYKFSRSNSFLCAENMGIYATFIRKVCLKKKLRICMESSLQIKRSLGIVRGKNDAVDAVRIAEYAVKNFKKLRLFQACRSPLELLKSLSTVRKRLIKAKVMLAGGRKVESYYYTRAEKKKFNRYSDSSIKMIDRDVAKVELAMDSVIREDQRLHQLMRIVTSVPRVGKVIATEMIIHTNEFKSIQTAKKFASYSGIAPFAWNSGTSVRGKTRVSETANKELKALLHMASMGSLRNKKSFLAMYYERKVKEGKNKMSVLNAIRNKIVHRIYSCVKNNKFFIERYGIRG